MPGTSGEGPFFGALPREDGALCGQPSRLHMQAGRLRYNVYRIIVAHASRMREVGCNSDLRNICVHLRYLRFLRGGLVAIPNSEF